jgi:ferredoxin-NADP reductase
VCGPVAFMAEIQTQLERHGVNPDHIQTESFGPVA